jgi:molybdopterin converting factor small subunit
MGSGRVRVKLKFFAHLADLYGATEEQRQVSSVLREALLELGQVVSSRLGGEMGSHYALLINGRNVREFEVEPILREGDRLAFVSMVSGGRDPMTVVMVEGHKGGGE